MATAEHKVLVTADAGKLTSAFKQAEAATKSFSAAERNLQKIHIDSARSEDLVKGARVEAMYALLKLRKELRAGIIDQKQFKLATDQVRTALMNKTAGINTMNKAMFAGRQMSRQMRAGFGQMGHQIQDIAVQLQMGQNAMLVFAQQGSQIASLFGPGGALVGAIMAVGGAIAMALIPNLKEAEETLDDIIEKGTQYKDLLELAADEDKAAVQLKILEGENAARQKVAETQFKQQKALEKLQDAQQRLKELEGQSGRALRDQGNLLSKASVYVAGLEKSYNDLSASLAKARNELKEYQSDSDLRKQAEKEMLSAAVYALKKLNDAEKVAHKERLNHAVYMLKQMNEAEKVAHKERLNHAVYTLKQMNEAEKVAHQSRLDSALYMLKQINEAEKKARNELEGIGVLGEDETIPLKDNYVKQLELVKQYANQHIITEQEKAEAIKRINENMQKAAISEFGKGMDALGAYNKKAFKISKAMKTAEAIMNTYAGANQALAAYPPPFSYMAAAGQIAYGMAQVAQIKSQTFAGRAAGGMVQAGQPYMVGEMGKEMFIPNTGGRIVNNRDTEAGLGTTNINFSITTVDAKGFGELLTSRRGQIVNMVNQAMHDKGRVGVTA